MIVRWFIFPNPIFERQLFTILEQNSSAFFAVWSLIVVPASKCNKTKINVLNFTCHLVYTLIRVVVDWPFSVFNWKQFLGQVLRVYLKQTWNNNRLIYSRIYLFNYVFVPNVIKACGFNCTTSIKRHIIQETPASSTGPCSLRVTFIVFINGMYQS